MKRRDFPYRVVFLTDTSKGLRLPTAVVRRSPYKAIDFIYKALIIRCLC